VQLTYDEITDSVYVYLSRDPVARTDAALPDLLVDYDVAGAVRGVEFLNASRGIDLGPVSHVAGLAEFLEGRNFPVYA
jgi:uncharacterized protein YuzE